MAPTISQTQLSYTTSGLLSTPAHRLDGRAALAFRPLRIAKGDLASHAVGSASCTLGAGRSATRCSVVVSTEVVHDEQAQDASRLIECNVDVDNSVAQSSNLQSLLTTLQKALSQAVRSIFLSSPAKREQFTILRHASPPHHVVRAWRLHVDVLFNDIAGGNVADVMFAAAYAALNDVELPQTRAISFQASAVDSTVAPKEDDKLDTFNVRGPRTRATGASTSQLQTQTSDSAATLPSWLDKERIGVDFELFESWKGTAVGLRQSKSFPVGVTVNVLPTAVGSASNVVLDATQMEEACVPYTRRLLVLCSQPASKTETDASSTSVVMGTYMLTPSLETGVHRLGEDDDPATGREASIRGTCEYKTIRQAIQQGQQFAEGLHAAIEAQIGDSEKGADEMQQD